MAHLRYVITPMCGVLCVPLVSVLVLQVLFAPSWDLEPV